jgi:acyl carrier protein
LRRKNLIFSNGTRDFYTFKVVQNVSQPVSHEAVFAGKIPRLSCCSGLGSGVLEMPCGHTFSSRHPGTQVPWLFAEGSFQMNTEQQVLSLLDELLGLGGRAAAFTRETALLGALPELDSMAVVALLGGLEERFGLVVDDDDIEGATFATVGTLVDFINARIAAH